MRLYGCPDCWTLKQYSGISNWVFTWCGLSEDEHRRVGEAREQAKKQAHELMVQERIDRQLPEAVIAEVYKEAERRVCGRY
jgi:hypothetical protein